MEVEYDLTPEDQQAFRRYHAKHPVVRPSKSGALVSIVVGVAVGLCFVSFIASRALLYDTLLYAPALYQLVNMLPGVAMGALLALCGLQFYLRLMQANVTRNALQEGRNAEKALGWRRLAIDPHALRLASAFSSTASYWEGIDAVVATQDYVFIYVTTRAAHVVPRRAFPDDRAFDDFVDTARRYHQISRLGDAARGPDEEESEWRRPVQARAAPPTDPADRGGAGIIAKARPPEDTTPRPDGERGAAS